MIIFLESLFIFSSFLILGSKQNSTEEFFEFNQKVISEKPRTKGKCKIKNLPFVFFFVKASIDMFAKRGDIIYKLIFFTEK